MQIDHINISAAGDLLAKVKDFYCGVLGLTEGHRPDFSVPGYWLYADGGAIIHLVEREGLERSERTGCLDHVAFRVADVDPILEKLEEHGLEYETFRVPDTSTMQIFLRDPSGLKVEISYDGDR